MAGTGVAIAPAISDVTPVRETAYVIASAVAASFACLTEVQRVYVAPRGNALFLWTVVHPFDRPVRNKIYELEERLVSQFPNTEFDFNLLDNSAESNLDTLAPGAHLLYKK